MRAIESRATTAAGRPTDLRALRLAIDAGEPWAIDIATDAGRWLGRSIAAVIGTLDVERIVLLGPVTELGDAWLRAVREAATSRALGQLAERAQISVGTPTTNVVIRGASALLVARELGLSLAR